MSKYVKKNTFFDFLINIAYAKSSKFLKKDHFLLKRLRQIFYAQIQKGKGGHFNKGFPLIKDFL